MATAVTRTERVDFDSLVREGQEPVRRYLLARTGSTAEAAELTQETLVRAYCALSKGEAPQHPVPWLLGIARNVLLEAARERRYARRLCEELASLTAREWQLPWHARLERRLIVGSAVDNLPAELREPVLLHYFAGLPPPEVAHHLGTTAGAVRTRLWRARQSLRGELEVLVRDTETTSRITAAEGPRNAGVLLEWFGTRCHGRCRHCLLRNTGRVCSLPFARAAAIADRFLAWRERENPQDFLVQLGGGYSDDFPHFAELVAFCRERELPTPAYFSVNGIAFRSDAEIAGLLDALTGLGQSGIHLTLFGVGEAHDRFAGRRGDFAFLLRFARRAAEAGFERTESIFLTQRNQGELLTLVEMLDGIPGMAQRRLWLLDYRGRAKSLERERITAAALATLPDSLRQYLRMGPPRPIHTEAEWIAGLQAGDVPRKTARYILLPIAEDNVEYLETSDPGEVMEAIWEAEDQFRQSLPSLLELSRLYGRPAGRRLYALRDLEWKWTDASLAQHPELDRSRAFDDTRVSVITH